MSERKYKKALRNHRPPYRPADWEALQAQLPQNDRKGLGYWPWMRYAAALLLLVTALGIYNGIDWGEQGNPKKAGNEMARNKPEKATNTVDGNEKDLGKTRENSKQGQASLAVSDSLHLPQEGQCFPQKNQEDNSKNRIKIHKGLAQQQKSPKAKAPQESENQAPGNLASRNQDRENQVSENYGSEGQELENQEMGDYLSRGQDPDSRGSGSTSPIHRAKVLSFPPFQVSLDSTRALSPQMEVASARPLLAVAKGEGAWRASVSAVHLPAFTEFEQNTTPDIAISRQWAFSNRITGEVGLSIGSHINRYTITTQVSEYARQDEYLRTSIFAGADYHFLVKSKWSLYAGLQAGRRWYSEDGLSVFSANADEVLDFGGSPTNPNLSEAIRSGEREWSPRWFVGPRVGAKLRLYRGFSAFTELSSSMNIFRFGLSFSRS